MRKSSKYYLKPLLLTFSVLTLGSCKKYLEVAPNKTSSVQISTTTDLDGLLNDYSGTFAKESVSSYIATDDFGLTTNLWDKLGGRGYTITNAFYATWDRAGTLSLSDPGWAAEYKKIFVANLVLSSLSSVTGSDSDKARLEAEAHFVRAYSYWVLTDVYCLPFTTSTANEMGVPLKLTTSFDENIERAPLNKVYTQIEEDIAGALKSTQAIVQSGKLRNWRANTAGIHTFAARYYLDRGNYQKALDEATASLSAYSTLSDYNTDLYVAFPLSFTINRGSTDAANPQSNFTVNLPSQFLAAAVTSKESTYLRYQTFSTGFCPPSQDLLNLYDQANDLRYTYNMISGYTFYLFSTVNYPAFNYPTYANTFFGQIMSGPCVPEAILIKAEAQARLGDFASAITTVNTLRVKRFKSTTPASITNLTALSQAEAITKILLERRRELPFTWRWDDMRRLNSNGDLTDDVTPTKTFYAYTASQINTGSTQTYTLPKASRAYAFPIPYSDIVAGNGVIKQNTY